MQEKTKKIWLAANFSHGCHRHFAVGVAAAGAERPDWEIVVRHYEDPECCLLPIAGADGLVAPHHVTADTLARAEDRGIPVVLYGAETARNDAASLSQCYPDESAIGVAAAEHLLERGFQHFAYVGSAHLPASVPRGDAFSGRVSAAGFQCSHFTMPRKLRSSYKLKQWLRGLAVPCGLLAVNDVVAQNVLRSLHEAGMRCPGEVALLGVDNDELLCALSNPSLTSIDTDWQTMGQQAAEVLAQQIAGKQKGPVAIETAPRRIVLRQSSDFLVISDERVLTALCYVRSHATEGISVDQVLEHVGCSRPTLDGHFKEHLGHTVSQEISRTKIEKAMRLLEETDASIESIAYECGFSYLDRMFRLFKKSTGITPGQYRIRERERPSCD